MYALEAVDVEVLKIISKKGDMTAEEISKRLKKDCSLRINVLCDNDILLPAKGTGVQVNDTDGIRYVPTTTSRYCLSPNGELALQNYEAGIHAGKRTDSIRFFLTFIVALIAAVASVTGTVITILSYFRPAP